MGSVSVKTEDRKQALKIAAELEQVEAESRKGAMTTVQLHKILSDVSVKVTGDSLDIPSTEDYLNRWLEGVSLRNAPTTMERYGNTVKKFLGTLGGGVKRPITTVTPRHVEEFMNARLKEGMAPKTVIVDLKTLNTAFRRAEAYGTILKNPVAAVRPPKNESSEREVFTQEEVQKMLNAAPSLDWQTLTLLGYFVGARLGDCVTMKWENVRPEDGVIVYEQMKTHKKVVVPMHYHVIEHLNYLSTFGAEGYLCPALAKKGPGGKHGLSESFKRIVVKAGLDPMVVQGKGARNFTKRTFHSLRHSFNSALANAGVTEEIRMKLTGHSSKAVHTQYTHFEVDALKNAMSSLPLFNRQKPGSQENSAEEGRS
jgi:integrase